MACAACRFAGMQGERAITIIYDMDKTHWVDKMLRCNIEHSNVDVIFLIILVQGG